MRENFCTVGLVILFFFSKSIFISFVYASSFILVKEELWDALKVFTDSMDGL